MSVSWLDVLQDTKDTAPPPKPKAEAEEEPVVITPKPVSPKRREPPRKKGGFFSCTRYKALYLAIKILLIIDYILT